MGRHHLAERFQDRIGHLSEGSDPRLVRRNAAEHDRPGDDNLREYKEEDDLKEVGRNPEDICWWKEQQVGLRILESDSLFQFVADSVSIGLSGGIIFEGYRLLPSRQRFL